MLYRTRIAQLAAQSQAKFRNFDGIVNQRGYRHAAGGGFAPAAQEILNPNDRTWTVKVVNSATTSKTATIFGANYDLTDALLDGNVAVTVAESSHLQLKMETLSQPVRIMGLKMTVNNATQFANVLYLYDNSSSGAQERNIWQPLNYRSAQNQLTTQIDAPSFELLVKPSVYIQFTINGSETVTFTFTIVEKANFANVLRNAPVSTVANKPAPTGLVQIDMPRGL